MADLGMAPASRFAAVALRAGATRHSRPDFQLAAGLALARRARGKLGVGVQLNSRLNDAAVLERSSPSILVQTRPVQRVAAPAAVIGIGAQPAPRHDRRHSRPMAGVADPVASARRRTALASGPAGGHPSARVPPASSTSYCAAAGFPALRGAWSSGNAFAELAGERFRRSPPRCQGCLRRDGRRRRSRCCAPGTAMRRVLAGDVSLRSRPLDGSSDDPCSWMPATPG